MACSSSNSAIHSDEWKISICLKEEKNHLRHTWNLNEKAAKKQIKNRKQNNWKHAATPTEMVISYIYTFQCLSYRIFLLHVNKLLDIFAVFFFLSKKSLTFNTSVIVIMDTRQVHQARWVKYSAFLFFIGKEIADAQWNTRARWKLDKRNE